MILKNIAIRCFHECLKHDSDAQAKYYPSEIRCGIRKNIETFRIIHFTYYAASVENFVLFHTGATEKKKFLL